MVLPGFTVGDRSTRYLRGRGYYVHGWRQGSNWGPTTRILRGLEARLAAIAEQHGEKFSLVGWSLGGSFAWKLARANPDVVRQVITLVTPVQLDHAGQLGAGPLYGRLRAAQLLRRAG